MIRDCLKSITAVLNYVEPDEKRHYEEAEDKSNHIFNDVQGARASVVELSNLLNQTIKVYGNPLTVGCLIDQMSKEDRKIAFSSIAEQMTQEGRLTL